MEDGRGFSHIGKVLFLDLGCRYTDVFFITFFFKGQNKHDENPHKIQSCF